MTLAMSHQLGLTSSFLSSALSGDRLDFLPSMDVYHLLTAGRGALGGGIVGGGGWKRWKTRAMMEVLDINGMDISSVTIFCTAKCMLLPYLNSWMEGDYFILFSQLYNHP